VGASQPQPRAPVEHPVQTGQALRRQPVAVRVEPAPRGTRLRTMREASRERIRTAPAGRPGAPAPRRPATSEQRPATSAQRPATDRGPAGGREAGGTGGGRGGGRRRRPTRTATRPPTRPPPAPAAMASGRFPLTVPPPPDWPPPPAPGAACVGPPVPRSRSTS